MKRLSLEILAAVTLPQEPDVSLSGDVSIVADASVSMLSMPPAPRDDTNAALRRPRTVLTRAQWRAARPWLH